MKRISSGILALFLITTSAVFQSGCSASSSQSKQNSGINESGTNFVVGQIQMVGNEPFTHLAVRNETSFYLLDCSGDVKDTVYNNQGRTAKIYFDKVTINDESIKVLKVDKVEILPEGM